MAKRTRDQRKRDNIKKETARRIAAGDTSSYVVKSAKKYGLEMPKVPGKGRYTKSTVNPTDKFEGAKDRARANQAYLDQSDRDFKKKIQELNRRRIIDDARTGSMDKSDFTGKDGSGIFGLGGNRVGQTYVNPETGKSFNFSKAREGLTSPQYSDWIRKNLGGPNAGRIENQAFRRTFPFASGAGLEKLMNLAAPFPLKMLNNLSKSDAGTMVGDLGGRKFRDFLSKFGDGTDNKIAKINLDAKKSTGELIDEVQDSTGLNSFRNYLSNFPGQRPVSSFVEDPRIGLGLDEVMTEYDPYIALDPRIGLGKQRPVNSFVEDPRLNIDEENLNPPGVIDLSEQEDLIDISSDSGEDSNLSEATKNYMDEYMQTYGKGSAPFERAKEFNDRSRQAYNEAHMGGAPDYGDADGIQSFYDVRGDEYGEEFGPAFLRDVIMDELDKAGDINYNQSISVDGSTLPLDVLFDKGAVNLDQIRDPSFYDEAFQDVDFRTGDIPAEAFSGARTALIPEAASIIPQTFNYNDGGYANMSTYQKLKMMADSYGD